MTRRWAPASSLMRPVRYLAGFRWLRQPAILLRRSATEFLDDHCTQMSAAIAYHVLFSLFPLAIAIVGVVGLVTSDPGARDSVVSLVLRAVPLSSGGKTQLHQLLGSVSGGAGALGLLGLVGVIWAASGVMAAIRTSLNIAWDTDHNRPFVRGKLVDLALVAGVFIVTGAALGVTFLASIARHGSIPLPSAIGAVEPATRAVLASLAYLAAAGLLFGTFLVLYRIVPAVDTKVRDIWPGALVAAIGFEVLQYGFSIYIAFFAHYNKVYGSLGAVIAFMFFVFLASAVFLFGAEVASEYPRMLAGLAPGESGPGAGESAPGSGDSGSGAGATENDADSGPGAPMRPAQSPR